ncbi:MAG TPA: hypothetical protein VGL97_06540 [Bryobacteraceae bacterium]
MYSKTRYFVAALMFAALSAAGTAMAATITSGSFADWESNLTGPPSDVDFTTISPALTAMSAVTLFGVSSPFPAFVFTSGDNSATVSAQSIGNRLGLESTEGTLEITSPVGGVNAFYLGFGTTGATPVTITLSDNEVFTLASSNTSVTGLWLSISHPIAWLTIASSGSPPVITGMSFGASNLTQDPTAAPETPTLLLVNGGLLVFAAARRKALLRLPA